MLELELKWKIGCIPDFLESCTIPIVIELHKDRPNSIVRIHQFDKFPEKPLKECHSGIYAYIEEFYTAWKKGTLSQRLSSYKVLVTLEDINWPERCDQIFCVVSRDGRENFPKILPPGA